MRLFRQDNMPWPWLSAHGGYVGLCYLPMKDVLALATCLSHGGLAHGCCIEFGYVALPWLLPHEGCHGIGSMHMGNMALATCPQGLLWP